MPFALTQLSGFGGGGGVTFFPTSVTTATLQAWYRSSGIVTSGSDVTDWTDESANSLDMAASNLPGNDGGIIISSAVNGQNSVRFDGTGDGIQSATFTAVTQPFHIFIVFKAITWTSIDRILDMNTGNTTVIDQRGTTPQVQQFAGLAQHPVSATLDSWFLLESFFNGGSSYNRLNNDAAVSGNDPGAGQMNELTMAAVSGGSNFWNGEIADLSVFDGTVSGSDLTNLRNNYYKGTFALF